MQTLLNKLDAGERLSKEAYLSLLSAEGNEIEELAGKRTRAYFGRKIYVRGLIEISNICKNDCYYCGIRKSNKEVERYRLTHEEVLSACAEGFRIGFRTFVLQGGEDLYWRGSRLIDLIREIRAMYPDCAITLSMGELPRSELTALFRAGANRYLLRHETINPEHYTKLHPQEMRQERRLQALQDIREIGFQLGSGVMIGAPVQELSHLAEDLTFIASLQPEMIGLGPFIPHSDTPFHDRPAGSLETTLRFIALCRLTCPRAHIPATTAIATLHPEGRKRAILSGANVVMPNLSPPHYRALYNLYDHKAHSGSEAAEGVALLEQELETISYSINWDRGDYR